MILFNGWLNWSIKILNWIFRSRFPNWTCLWRTPAWKVRYRRARGLLLLRRRQPRLPRVLSILLIQLVVKIGMCICLRDLLAVRFGTCDSSLIMLLLLSLLNVNVCLAELPMNKIQVGFAPSPNLKTVKSKIGSMDNATHKPGGGNVKIETRKIQIEAKPRIGARNENYVKAGGDVKVKYIIRSIY